MYTIIQIEFAKEENIKELEEMLQTLLKSKLDTFTYTKSKVENIITISKEIGDIKLVNYD